MARRYSNSEINKAGQELIKYNIEDPKLKDSLVIISEWRDAHFFALEKLNELLNLKSKQVGGKDHTIVSRLKKMESIKLKLTISPKMNLSRMQDIGGCRIIVNNLTKVNAIVSRFSKFHKGFDFIEINDYVENPKTTGYRCIHMVFRYKDKSPDNYKILIELQCRTKLQHAWATAVETVGFFTNKALKSNQGEEYWKKFFILVSKLFEYEETGRIVNDERTIVDIVAELQSHDKKHKCISKISGYKVGSRIINEHYNENEFFLLILNMSENRLIVHGYKKEDLENAQEKYLSIEKESNPDINAVLVSASSIEDLKIGYQNYFNNTALFLNKYKDLTKKYSK